MFLPEETILIPPGNLGNVLTATLGGAGAWPENNLPENGSTIYVTLYSYVGGQWLSTASTYVSGP